MTDPHEKPQPFATEAEAATRQIPPMWPLAATVAVNPFLGQKDDTLMLAAARLGRVGITVTRPRRDYHAMLEAGTITDRDLAAALARTEPHPPLDAAALRAAASQAPAAVAALPTVSDLAAQASGIDWPRLIEDRSGFWAAGHFDQGQALWPAPQLGAFASWQAFARRDLTPEIQGLTGFAAYVAGMPPSPPDALAHCAAALGLDDASAPSVFHRLLVMLGGWGQLARGRAWQAEQAGGSDPCATELLTMRLVWEAALLERYRDAIAERWDAVRAAYAAPLEPTADQRIDVLLQEAADHAAQRRLARVFAADRAQPSRERPALQAAFCIDVRSEVFRRALESVDGSITTLGFAGFFGLAVRHRPLASDVAEARAPVLLTPALDSTSTGSDALDAAVRLDRRALRAWGRFKLAAVSSFAFVEAAGPIYGAKLIRDALGQVRPGDPEPRPAVALAPAGRVDAAETILRAMSLTQNFARLILIAGHGAHVVNAPYASALQCGACGGHGGEVNARLLAGLLNEPEVRLGLAARGIALPEDTHFIAGLHDTVTDVVTLYEDDAAPAHAVDLARLRDWLAAAGRLARGERSPRLPRSRGARDLLRRGRDWAEVRPEWALAGCNAFIAAPRRRTEGRDLGGSCFLHSYDWRQDAEFRVLELILTAPVVVASWIGLQYYGSCVAPETFGAGNKLLHNIVGGIGVVEGNGGVLRSGLPWQSVHDGTRLVHEPLRLSVAIEAPREAIAAILERHAELRALFDNGWLALFAIDNAGRLAWRYAGGLEWREALSGSEVEAAAA